MIAIYVLQIIKRAAEQNVPWLSLARHYEAEFLDDMDYLGVLPPTIITRVTEHIGDIVDYIGGIEQQGLAYEAEDGVYFDTQSFGPQYGKLGPNAATESQEAHDPTTTKRDARDFALWKLAKPGEPFWESPWGEGRPGWHIECSAMTEAIFGSELVLHAGGIDLAFPHHCNEIAQCEAHNGAEDWCQNFIHTGHLHIKGLKMSKSLKNFITVREFIQEHSSPGGSEREVADLFRMFCLLHKYSANITYSPDRIRDAKSVLRQFQSFLQTTSAHIHAGTHTNTNTYSDSDSSSSTSIVDKIAKTTAQETVPKR